MPACPRSSVGETTWSWVSDVLAVAKRMTHARLLRASFRQHSVCCCFRPLVFHRDSTYFDFDPSDVVTVWLALDDMTPDLGPLEYDSWAGFLFDLHIHVLTLVLPELLLAHDDKT